MYSLKKLEIRGYGAKPLPNTFFRQDEGTDHLALVFPGYHYRCDAPLLQNPTRILLSSGADVLLVEYAYDLLPEWGSSDSRTRMRWLSEDSSAAFRTASRERSYKRITLVGKSLGTEAMGRVLAAERTSQQAKAIWLTPILTDPDLMEQLERAANPSLLIIGSADDYYDGRLLERLRKKPSMEILMIPEANHVLKVEGEPLRSIAILKDITEAVQRFISN
jgi:hypothetical protein